MLEAAHHDEIAAWVKAGDVPVRKMVELLARSGVVVPERTLNRYVGVEVREAGRARRSVSLMVNRASSCRSTSVSSA